MVDLAGSERSGKTGTEGATAKEATYINKSLSFLEQVSTEVLMSATLLSPASTLLRRFFKADLSPESGEDSTCVLRTCTLQWECQMCASAIRPRPTHGLCPHAND